MKFLNSRLALMALAATLVCGFGVPSQAAFYGPANGPEGAVGDGPADFDAPFPDYPGNLTPEQIQGAQKIFNDSYAGMDQTRKELAVKRAELNAELDSANPDKAKIERLATEIGQLRGKMMAARADVRAKLKAQGLPVDFYGPRGFNGGRNWRGPNRGWQGQNGPAWGCPGMWNGGCPGWGGPRHWGRHHMGPRHHGWD